MGLGRFKRASAINQTAGRKEEEAFQELLQSSERWETAGRFRRYIAAKEALFMQVGVTPEQEEWLVWAKGKVEGYDPVGRCNM